MEGDTGIRGYTTREALRSKFTINFRIFRPLLSPTTKNVVMIFIIVEWHQNHA